VLCDKNSTIVLSKNHVFQKKTKDVDTRYHFIKELVNNKEFFLEFCSAKDQILDIFTKSLERDAFQYPYSFLGVCTVANI
jgi:hypothetical protein